MTTPRRAVTGRGGSASFCSAVDEKKPASDPVPLAEARAVRQRLAALTKRLSDLDTEREDDALAMGRLLAEIADRDRRLARVAELEESLRGAEARAEREAGHARELSTELEELRGRVDLLVAELEGFDTTYAETIADLEAAQDRFVAAVADRERLHLELAFERDGREILEARLEETRRDLAQARLEIAMLRRGPGPKPKPSTATMKRIEDRSRRSFARTEISWLLETIDTVLVETRDASKGEAARLDEVRGAIVQLIAPAAPADARELARSVSARLRHTLAVQKACGGVREATQAAARTIDALHRSSAGEDEAADTQTAERAATVGRALRSVRDMVAPLVGAEPSERPPPLRRPRRPRDSMIG